MKITCEYCESYIETDGCDGRCPHCNASLGDAIAAYEAQKKQEEAEQAALAEQKAKEQAAEEKKRTVFNALIGVAGTAASAWLSAAAAKSASSTTVTNAFSSIKKRGIFSDWNSVEHTTFPTRGERAAFRISGPNGKGPGGGPGKSRGGRGGHF